MSDKIILKGLVFYAYHGAFPGEKELGQRYEVDVELYTDISEPAKLDDLEFTIDYTDVYEIVKKVMYDRDYNLIEALCNSINEAIFTKYDLRQITTRVRKPHAPIGGPMDYVEVEITKVSDKSSLRNY